MFYLFAVKCSSCGQGNQGKYAAIRDMEQQCDICGSEQIFSEMNPIDPEFDDTEWPALIEDFDPEED